jgi:hypothetical protein
MRQIEHCDLVESLCESPGRTDVRPPPEHLGLAWRLDARAVKK